jgi:aldehyde dehydrogenase (NAD+)
LISPAADKQLSNDMNQPGDSPQHEVGETDPAYLKAVFDSQQPTALRWRTSTARERIARITSLGDAMLAQREALYAAFQTDFGKCPSEVEGSELLPVVGEMRHAIKQLKRWMKPRKVRPTLTMIGTSSEVQHQPRGRVLIIAPWNYPLSLCFGPLVSALAAGNTVIIKPSEMTPAVSTVMAKIIGAAFPPSEVALIEGGMPTSQALLNLPFDHVFFTGSPAVGKIVMAAAARHLASVTLELGGKSPVIIGATANIALAAETVMWAKLLNNGQTCVAPDYVYVHESVKHAFADACCKAIQKFYGDTVADQMSSPDLARIINQRHVQRISSLLDDAMARGARLLAGGEVDVAQCFIAPTLLDNVAADATIMEEEIFGPVLPILDYTEIDDVIADINARPKPLALYCWSNDQKEIDNVLTRTSSGGACINYCVVQFMHGGLPFGGVNNSGIGNAHGYFGFRAFSHERAVLRSSRLMLAKLYFPPFTARRSRLIRWITDLLR